MSPSDWFDEHNTTQAALDAAESAYDAELIRLERERVAKKPWIIGGLLLCAAMVLCGSWLAKWHGDDIGVL